MRLALPFLIVVSGAAAAVGFARDGRACGNAMTLAEEQVMNIAISEDHTKNGRHRTALQVLARTVEPMPELGKNGVLDHAVEVQALAIARLDGRFDRVGEPVAPERTGRTLEWSITTLSKLLEKKPKDPSAVTNYAEALSHAPGRDKEALALLAPLEAKNVMPGAYGYIALARMRERAARRAPGFIGAALAAEASAPRAIAMERCARMASERALCKGEDEARATKGPLHPVAAKR